MMICCICCAVICVNENEMCKNGFTDFLLMEMETRVCQCEQKQNGNEKGHKAIINRKRKCK